MLLWSADRVCVRGTFEKDWGVLVDDQGTIQAIGPRGQLVARAKQVFHYPGQYLLPAFVNPHQYGFQRLFRGLTNFSAPFEVLKQKLVWPLSQAIEDELLDAVYRVGFVEQALAGIGTVGEFFYLHNAGKQDRDGSGYAKRIIEIADKLGIRLSLIYAFFDQGSTESTRAFIQPLHTGIEEFHRLTDAYADNPRIDILPGIHGLEHTSAEAILAAVELSESLDLPLHIRLAESPEELAIAKTHYGTTPLRALDKMNAISDRLVVVNGTLLDDEELAMLRHHQVPVVLCPSASLSEGREMPNTLGLLRNQIPFCVGASSAGLMTTYSIPEEIKLLEYSQRSLQKRMNILKSQTDVNSLLDLGTRNSADILGLNVSQLMPGSPADFMLVDIGEAAFRPHFGYEQQHFMNQLIFGWGSQVNVTHLVVEGRVVVDNTVVHEELRRSYIRIEQWSHALLRFIEKNSSKGQNKREEAGAEHI